MKMTQVLQRISNAEKVDYIHTHTQRERERETQRERERERERERDVCKWQKQLI